jgi:hypothetical protein
MTDQTALIICASIMGFGVLCMGAGTILLMISVRMRLKGESDARS